MPVRRKPPPEVLEAAEGQVPAGPAPTEISPLQLVQALESLYKDRLNPTEDLVLRRLKELTGYGWGSEDLQAEANWMPEIQIVAPQDGSGGKTRGASRRGHSTNASNKDSCTWYYLRTPPPGFQGFVDPGLLVDSYPNDLWEHLQDELASTSALWSKVRASSRYNLACALLECVPRLQQYSLGEVCHIIQLAVRVHRLLGYRRGLIVAFEDSWDAEKLQRAEDLEADGHSNAECSWEAFRQKLGELLDEYMQQRSKQGLPLSALKQVYHRRYGMCISETALGHTQLSTLVRDPRLDGVCVVEHVGHENVLVSRHYATGDKNGEGADKQAAIEEEGYDDGSAFGKASGRRRYRGSRGQRHNKQGANADTCSHDEITATKPWPMEPIQDNTLRLHEHLDATNSGYVSPSSVANGKASNLPLAEILERDREDAREKEAWAFCQ